MAMVRRIDRLKDHLKIDWVARGPRSGRLTQRLDGELLLTAVPVTVYGNLVGALHISERLLDRVSYIETTVRRTALNVLANVLICGLVALGLGYWLVGWPVRRLVNKAREVGAGDFSGPLEVHQRDELGELGHEMHEMAQRLANAREALATEISARVTTLEQLRHSDRLRMVGQIAAGVAHELGSPMSVIAGRAQLIEKHEIEAQEIPQSARIIRAQIERMSHIVRQLLDTARRGHQTRVECDAGDLAARVVSLLAAVARKEQIELRYARPSAPLSLHADAGQIQQVLMNIIVNGIQAMPEGGTIDLEIQRVRARSPALPCEEAEWARVTVCDHGVGMSPEVRQHLFEPFFTTKDVGEGTGLGLAVSRGIVEEHGGWIAVESHPGKGSQFSVFLPCADRVASEVAASTSSAGIAPAGGLR